MTERRIVAGIMLTPGRSGRVILGLLVIALGVLFTLDNLGIANAGDILRFWPAALLGYGLMRLSGIGCSRHIASGIVFSLVGGWLLLCNLHVIHGGIGTLWPLFLVVIGASMISGGARRVRGMGMNQEGSATLNAFAFMSGTHRKVLSQEFRGGEITAVMGGHEIDLRGAQIQGEAAVIDMFIWMGGADIRVPADWKVSCEALPIMGGIEDSTQRPGAEVRGHLILKGLVVMGGIEIKN